MSQARPIGGVFETEPVRGGAMPYPDAIALSTGRACLAALLRHVKPWRVHVPFYTCNTAYQPLVDLGIPVALYAVDETLRPAEPPVLADGEYFLWTNYFGVCGRTTAELAARYGERLIVDDTQAFFSGRHAGLWSFNSARKFFGVPDGAFLFAPCDATFAAPRFDPGVADFAALRGQGRLMDAERAYAAYERRLDAAVRRISETGENLLRGIDLAHAARIRRENFAYLHARLGQTNRLSLDPAPGDVPFCYPYLPVRPLDRAVLYRQNILVPVLWRDAVYRAVDGFAWERHLGRTLLPLPIDQRYGPDDMRRLCDIVEAIRRNQ
jgi:hypothetical protein